jgi:hypothetical protein
MDVCGVDEHGSPVAGATPDVQLNRPDFSDRWLDLRTGQATGASTGA